MEKVDKFKSMTVGDKFYRLDWCNIYDHDTIEVGGKKYISEDFRTKLNFTIYKCLVIGTTKMVVTGDIKDYEFGNCDNIVYEYLTRMEGENDEDDDSLAGDTAAVSLASYGFCNDTFFLTLQDARDKVSQIKVDEGITP